MAEVNEGELDAVVGTAHVLSADGDRRAYAADRAPLANFLARVERIPGTLPSRIVRPASTEEVMRLVAHARQRGLRLIPYGLGSGVLGGTVPLDGEVVVDLGRLDGIVELNETDGLVTVRAGTNGGAFEAELNRRGFTCGHLPQSIHISTVGGWVACRGGGQASTRYGKIEDLVVGLKAVLPDGRLLEIRPVPRRSTGPSLLQLVIGSEGTIGIITEVTLRVFRRPEAERGAVLAFPTCGDAWEAARRILQAELRPAVVRIYDEAESRERTKGVDVFGTRPVLSILQFAGPDPLVEVEERLSLAIAAGCGAVPGPIALYERWEEARFTSLSKPWQERGYYVDTIEVAATWSALPAMYEAMGAAVAAIAPDAHFGAHWSHAYPEGACQYMTMRLPPMENARALELHAAVWDEVETLALAHGGTIAHHHGVGLFRGKWMREELGVGLDVLQGIKDAIDPETLFKPGTLGLRRGPRAAAAER